MIRTRIAPTPSGYLHLGNALNFVLTWLWARKAGGTIHLRIDDLDAPRARPEYLADIFDTLAWLGINWDSGPADSGEQATIYSQVLHSTRYDTLIDQLIATGLVYACECSRRALAERPCPCRSLVIPLSQPDTALRIITPAAPIVIQDFQAGSLEVSLQQYMPDFIIRRRDGIAAYQIASLADDLDSDINLIIRGQDLLPSTAAQLYLTSLVGADSFFQTTFYHHPLLTDEKGLKLSKSAGSYSLKAMREQHADPALVFIALSKALPLSADCHSLKEMLDLFSIPPSVR